jgi:hypothetical protein
MQAFFENFGIEQWLAVISALIAVASFILNMRLVSRQEKRNAVAMKMAHDSDVISWSSDVVALIAATQEVLVEKGVSYGESEFPMRRSTARAQLSALIDRGRLFFPNRPDGDYGMDKPAGFRGRRHRALDVLVKGYDLLDKAGASPGPDRTVANALNDIRRDFMAEIFNAVDPVRRGEKIKELTA